MGISVLYSGERTVEDGKASLRRIAFSQGLSDKAFNYWDEGLGKLIEIRYIGVWEKNEKPAFVFEDTNKDRHKRRIYFFTMREFVDAFVSGEKTDKVGVGDVRG